MIINDVKIIRKFNRVNNRILQFSIDRDNIEFVPGQYFIIGIKGDLHTREYSICSSTRNKDFIDFLVEVIPGGVVSPKLAESGIGDKITIDGPYGQLVDQGFSDDKNYFFICTGTGAVPFCSIVKSFDIKNYKVIHGVSKSDAPFYKDLMSKTNYISCNKTLEDVDFNGNILDYVKQLDIEEDMIFQICGNGQIVTSIKTELNKKGCKINQIRSEEFYFD